MDKRLFERLRAIGEFQREHRTLFNTVEDYHLLAEIGYHQSIGKPVALKQLYLLDIGSVATVQRRLRRLKTLGLIQERRTASDRRTVELRLSAKCLHLLASSSTVL